MSMMFIKVIIKDYPIALDYQVDHLGKKSTFSENGLRKSAWWHPPDSDDKLKIVRMGLQTLYGVHQGNH